MALKRDDSFLQFLTMGATGAAQTLRDLQQRGHRAIELDRGSTGNKIWATKIKRLRLPDLLCLNCGIRVEARAKSKLEVKLSDSPTVSGREWDAGLGDNDLVALVQATWDGAQAIPAQCVEYFHVRDLRATEEYSKLGPPKSAGEGAERDRTWPAWVPSYAGRVAEVDSTHVTVETGVGGRRRQALRPGFVPYLARGESFAAGGRLLAGVVPKPQSVNCPGPVWDPFLQGTLDDAGLRYAAIKALGFAVDEVADALERLNTTWADTDEDYRVRLEALAGLARLEPDNWIDVLEQQVAAAPSQDMAMEAVFILSELSDPKATTALARVLAQSDFPEEVRSAAAWGIGTGEHAQPGLLVRYLDDDSDDVAAHSLIAMGTIIPDPVLRRVADRLGDGNRAAASAVNVLARQQGRGAAALLERVGRSPHAAGRPWALFGLGMLGRDVVVAASGTALTDDLRNELEPLWAGLTDSWLVGDRLAAVQFLAKQTVRELGAA